MLALSPDELAENSSRKDGRTLALVPTGGFSTGFSADERGYLFYDHVLRGRRESSRSNCWAPGSA